MKLILLTVGKTNVPWVKDGLDLCAARLQHYARFEIREIPELKNTASLSEEQIKSKEGELILKEVKDAEMILLDEHGDQYRSLEFARELQNRMNRSTRDICFVVGGAYGFSPEVYARASGKISLSKMGRSDVN